MTEDRRGQRMVYGRTVDNRQGQREELLSVGKGVESKYL